MASHSSDTLNELSHLIWVHQQNVRYGEVAKTEWQLGFGLWRAALVYAIGDGVSVMASGDAS
jgi:hypothetical protein